LISYWIAQAGGLLAHVSIFTAASILIGTVVSLAQRRIAGLVLRDFTVSIPEFSTLSFEVNDEHRRVAWRLFVETASRVSTQPLAADDGFLKEAMDSLYKLFGTVREELKTMEPSRSGKNATVEMFALEMLNDELRPFLTKWHPALERFESEGTGNENDWQDASECRNELEAMRKRILKYAQAFGELAGLSDIERYFSDQSER
jgi:hypothetical protein